jgi:hypothetical protein
MLAALTPGGTVSFFAIAVLVVLAAAVAYFAGRRAAPPALPSTGPSPEPSRVRHVPDVDPQELARTAALRVPSPEAVTGGPDLLALHLVDNAHRFHFVLNRDDLWAVVLHPPATPAPLGLTVPLNDPSAQGLHEVLSNLEERIRRSGVLDLPPHRAAEALQPDTLRAPSSRHVRIVLRGAPSWVSLYEEGERLPAELLTLLLDLRALGFAALVPQHVQQQVRTPELLHFELIDEREEFRLASTRGKGLMLTHRPPGAEKRHTYLVSHADNGARLDLLHQRLATLVDLHRVPNLQPREPKLAMSPTAHESHPFVVRLLMEGGKGWATCYEAGAQRSDGPPPELEALERDVRTLAEEQLTQLAPLARPDGA